MKIKEGRTHWDDDELTKVGVVKFNIWATPMGDLLSELKVDQCVEDNIEVHLHMAAMTAAIQSYLNSAEFGDIVEHHKNKFRKVVDIANIKTKRAVPDIIKYQQQLPFPKGK
jgi:hypothetical protein